MTSRESHRANVARYIAPDAEAWPEEHAAFMADWGAHMDELVETVRQAQEHDDNVTDDEMRAWGL